MNAHAVLLTNPPRIQGFAWTREGRCQEKEDTLGTVKPPLSLALIAALLRDNNINFQLLDATALGLNGNGMYQRLMQINFHPDMIVYGTTTATIAADTASLSPLKEKFHAKLVAFGAHISGVPRETLEKVPDIDIGIIGEPEYTILDLLNNNNLEHLSDVAGIVWRSGKEIVVTKRRPWIEDMNQLPQPAWDLFPLEKYVLPFTRERYLMVETSRGCPFACDFCVATLNHGKKFREKKAKTVVDEIENLKNKFHITTFNLFGDTVTLNKKFVETFCDELIGRRLSIRWLANTRADTLYDQDLVKKMKESGCWMLSIGIESFSEKTRNTMQKKLETDKITRAISLLRKTGIVSFGFFIYGYPGETEEDMAETTRFALSLPLDYANFYPAVPYPGTAFYDTCVNDGLLQCNSWDKMEYSHYVIKTKELHEKTVKKAISRAYRRFYLRPRFIFRHIKNIGIIPFLSGSVKYGLKFLLKS
ncbi:radical SAM superfamily enzyme YgiQ [Candidatus Brocadia pituitae]|nr:radical SAM superfamily enzyme YgiQ [Candidatus Brocadia pituitae]